MPIGATVRLLKRLGHLLRRLVNDRRGQSVGMR
jgi:hypothetical protein